MKPAPTPRTRAKNSKNQVSIRKGKKSGWSFAVTTGYRKLLKGHKGLRKSFLRAISENRKELVQGKTVNADGMEIRWLSPGNKSFHTQEIYRVRIGKKMFFVKKGTDYQQPAFERMQYVKDWLKSKKNLLEGIRIKIIPHFLTFDQWNPRLNMWEQNWLVTGWLPEGALSEEAREEGITNEKTKKKLKRVIDLLDQRVYFHKDAGRNVYFSPRENTLYLTDLSWHRTRTR